MSEAYAIEGPATEIRTGRVSPMLWHEYANLFPMLEGVAFDELVEDVRAKGVQEPIVMFEGKVLDGRNRYRAAIEADKPYPIVQYEGDDALGFVVSLNLKRRHLTETQRAGLAAKIANMPHGGNRRSDQAANLPLETPMRPPISQAEAARMMNVSERTVRLAAHVLDHGTPALVASVETGDATVSAAEKISRLPESAQDIIAEAGPEAIRQVAADIRKGDPAAVESTAYDRLKAGDPEAAEVVREAVREAIAKPAQRASNANPIHEKNPANDAALAAADAAKTLAKLIADHSPEYILGGFVTPESRARGIAKMRAGWAALNAILERADVQDPS
jgi:ParB-like chromosome segregation protein Spo0J